MLQNGKISYSLFDTPEHRIVSTGNFDPEELRAVVRNKLIDPPDSPEWLNLFAAPLTFEPVLLSYEDHTILTLGNCGAFVANFHYPHVYYLHFCPDGFSRPQPEQSHKYSLLHAGALTRLAELSLSHNWLQPAEELTGFTNPATFMLRWKLLNKLEPELFDFAPRANPSYTVTEERLLKDGEAIDLKTTTASLYYVLRLRRFSHIWNDHGKDLSGTLLAKMSSRLEQWRSRHDLYMINPLLDPVVDLETGRVSYKLQQR